MASTIGYIVPVSELSPRIELMISIQRALLGAITDNLVAVTCGFEGTQIRTHPNCADGEFPLVLIHAIDGDFYGVTQQGGIIKDRRSASMGSGTVYKITREGYVRTLHTFDGTHGGAPSALVQATDGNFYGAASIGGPLDEGILFRIKPDGQFTTLHEFCKDAKPNTPVYCKLDGAIPTELFQATDGMIYGTTYQGEAAVRARFLD